MKYIAAVIVPVFLLALGASALAEKEKEEGKVTKCPISGKPVDESVSLNINGKPLYFCCEKCPEAYKKKIALIEDKEHKCVFTGKEINPEKTLIHKKVELITFCCNNCKGKWAEENKIAFKDGTGKCPISGKPGKEETAIVVNGEKIVFCCENCPKKYKKTELAGLTVKNGGNCPRTGKPGDPATAQILVTYKEVNFCCGKCQSRYIKEEIEAKQKKEKGEEKGDEGKGEETKVKVRES